MQKLYDILKLRTLICFLNRESDDCSVSKIARTLGEEKYTISRILMALEKEGLVNRKNSRSPHLTEQGKKEAEKYADRIRISMNHLIYEGVDLNSAQTDAYHWALYNTEESMTVFRTADECYRVKYELSGKKQFNGAELCKRMKDGVYRFPFLIYREDIFEGNNISWANEAFEHPCTLSIKNGKGMVRLCPKNMKVKHPETGKVVKGYLRHLKYSELGEYVNAENNGTVLSFPASCLNFINIGSGMEQILHGSVCVKLGNVVGNGKVEEITAIFTILI